MRRIWFTGSGRIYSTYRNLYLLTFIAVEKFDEDDQEGRDLKGTGCGGLATLSMTSSQARTGTTAAPSAWPMPGRTRGSQFLINLMNNNFLDSKHPVFGKAVEGMDVMDAWEK